MKVKMFSFKKGLLSLWDIPTEIVEREVNDWLVKHPNIDIKEIQRNICPGIWAPAQLIISIYYTEK